MKRFIPLLFCFFLFIIYGKATDALLVNDNSCPFQLLIYTTPVTSPGANDGTATIGISGGSAPYAWQWSNGATSATINNLQTGQYCVTATDSNGCIATACETIQNCALNLSIMPYMASCYGVCDGFMYMTITGGIPPYTFSHDPSILYCAGTYIVSVTDAVGCMGTASATITEPYEIIGSITSTPASGPGANDGSATVTAYNGNPPYTWQWSTGATTALITNLPPGQYCATVTDSNGCNDIICTTVQGCPLTVSITPTPTVCIACLGSVSIAVSGGTPPYTYAPTQTTGLCAGTHVYTVADAAGCTQTVLTTILSTSTFNISQFTTIPASGPGANDGSASVTATGGSPPYAYDWSNGGTTATINNLPPGQYCVTVTDMTGCMATSCGIVSGCSPLNVNTILNYYPSCNGVCDGSVSIAITGGTPPYTYTPTQTNNLCAGTYVFTAVDANGCTGTASITIIDPLLLTVNVTTTPASGPGANDGSATAIPSGGDPPYTWQWSIGATSATINNLSLGTYCVTVTDNQGCSVTSCGTVQGCPMVNVNLNVNNVPSCNGMCDGSVSISVNGGTPPYTYTPTQTNNLCAGTYVFTAVDANGCTGTASVSISEPSPIGLTVTSTPVTSPGANDGSATAIASGGTLPYSYTWSNGATTQMIGNLSPGQYCVTVTDANACMAASCVTIQGCQPLNVNVIANNGPSCNGMCDGSVSISVNGGTPPYTYTPAQTNNLCAGNYVFTAVDANGCIGTASVSISEPTLLGMTITTTPVSSPGANDGSATAIANGGTPAYNYTWSNGANTPTITNLTQGIYCVTISDTNGCTAVSCVTILGCSVLNVNATLTNNASCNGMCDGSVSISISGGTPPYTYTPTQTNNLCAGTYVFTAVDAQGCTGTASVTVAQPTAVTLVATSTPVSSPGANDGTATANVAGGTVPYTYIWSNGATTQIIGNLSPGQYCVTVTDANGCVATACTTIQGCSVLNVNATLTNNVSCNGMCDGSVSISIGGGTPPYTYTPSQTNNLCAGTYLFTAVDANGCTGTTSVTVAQPSALSLSVTSTSVTSPGANDGSATAVVNGGTAPYSYNWSNGATTPIIINLPPATFCVTVTDANGCTITACGTVQSCPALNIMITPTPTYCSACLGSVSILVTGGAPPYSYIPAQTTNLCAGNYVYTIVDANGCTGTATATILSSSTLNVTIASTPVSSPGANDGSASTTLSGGTAPYSWVWSNGATTPTINNLPPGQYCVTVTDATGCMETACTTVQGCPLLNVSITVDGNVSCNGVCDGSVLIAVSGGTPPYTYSPSQTTNLCAGTHVYLVTDANGCFATTTTIITEPPPISLTFNTVPPSGPGTNDGSSTVIPSSGSSPFTWHWSNGAATQTINNLSPGTYCVTVTDANGCFATACTTVQGCPALNVNINAMPVSCFGECDGSMAISVNGGTPPYTYTPTQTTNLCAGTYTVTVVDANGCAATASATVVEPAEITLTITTTPVSTPGGNDGTATVTINTGGIAPFEYIWSNGAYGATSNTMHTVYQLSEDYYCVTVVDNNGCSVPICENVGGPPSNNQGIESLQAIAVYPNPASNHLLLETEFKQAVELEIQLTNIIGQVFYRWSSSSKQQAFSEQIDVSALASGLYLLELRVDHQKHVEKIVKF